MVKYFLLIAVAFVLSACATTGKVVVRSEPPQAKVYMIDSQSGQNALIGETPLTFERSTFAKSGKDVIQIRIEKDGFEPKYSAVASFGGETTFLDMHLSSIAVASSEIRQSFEMSRTLMNEANRLVIGKRYSEALSKVEKLIELDPKNADALAAKGSVLYLMKDYDGASQAWIKALEINPGFSSVRESLNELNLRNIDRSPASKGRR